MVALLLAASFALALGCEAPTGRCVADDCTGDAGTGSDAGTGGGDGGPATLPCLGGCLANQPPMTGDIPCDVWRVLDKLPLASGGCHGCHSDPPQHGAPFPLVTYEQLQQPYGTTPLRLYQEMCVQIQPASSAFFLGTTEYQAIPHMPFGQAPQLSAADFKTLDDWFNACAPPAPEGSLSTAPGDGGAACCVPRTCAQIGVTCGVHVWNGCEGYTVCDDGAKDGAETDVDCGGDAQTCPNRCGPGKACVTNADCDPVQGLACGPDLKCH